MESNLPIYYKHVLKKMFPKLKEGIDFTIVTNSYAGVNWLNKSLEKPTLTEIEAAFLHLHFNPTDDYVDKKEIATAIKKRNRLLEVFNKIFRRKK